MLPWPVRLCLICFGLYTQSVIMLAIDIQLMLVVSWGNTTYSFRVYLEYILVSGDVIRFRFDVKM